MRLFYDPISTTSRPVLLMLSEAGIEVDLEVVSILSGEQNAPAFRAINPKGLVPALEIEPSFVLTEVDAILRWLARHHAPHLYPNTPRDQARVDEAMSWLSTDLHLFLDFCSVYLRSLLRHLIAPPVADALAALAAPRVEAMLTHFDAQFSAHAFVAGDRISIADFLGYSYVSLADLVAFEMTPWPAVTRWVGHMAGLPGRDAAFAAFDALVAAGRREAAARRPT